MIEDMQLRGLAERTQGAYVRAVRRLAEYYGRSPDEIGEEELRQCLPTWPSRATQGDDMLA